MVGSLELGRVRFSSTVARELLAHLLITLPGVLDRASLGFATGRPVRLV